VRVIAMASILSGCASRTIYDGASLRPLDYEALRGRPVIVHSGGETIFGSLLDVRVAPESLFVVLVPDIEEIGAPETLALRPAEVSSLELDRRRPGTWAGMVLFLVACAGAVGYAIVMSAVGSAIS
jgi:hypothetical protein